MPDINLLKDTQRPEDEKRKKPSEPWRPEMTRPERTSIEKDEGKAPSKFSMFFKNLFSKKEKIPSSDRILETPSTPDEDYKLKKDEKVEDIFSEITDEVPAEKPAEEKVKRGKIIFSKTKKKTAKPFLKSIIPEEEPEESSSFLVNLLPEEMVGGEKPREKLIRIILSMVISVFVVVIAYVGIVIYETRIVSKTQDIRKQNTEIEAKIYALRDTQKETIAFKQKLDSVSEILNSHIYWNKFFEKLEKYTLKDVYYSGGLTASTTGQISLLANAPDYATVAEQLEVLKKASDFVSAVSINSAQKSVAGQVEGINSAPLQTNKVSFEINMNLASGIFYRDDSEIGVSGGTNSNTNANANTNTSGTTSYAGSCESDNFKCYYIKASPHPFYEGYYELELRGIIDPTLKVDTAALAPLKVGNNESYKCYFGTSPDKDNAEYIRCTILASDYKKDASAEITFPFNEADGTITFKLPKLSTQ